MTCEYPGCRLPVQDGSRFCSPSHQIQLYAYQGWSQFQSWLRPTVEQSKFCDYSNCSSLVPVAEQYCPVHRPNQYKARRRPTTRVRNEQSIPGVIYFYHKSDPFYEFTNFSPHPIRYSGKDYPTSEHLFQCLKFEDPHHIEYVRQQSTPRDALRAARGLKTRIRKNWVEMELNIKAMEKVLLLKFTQHEDLKQILLSTGDAALIEDSDVDAFWGIGADGRGHNHLGLSLMKVRSILRQIGG